MEKNKILNEVYELVKEKGCYQEVMDIVNLGWSGYKGKIDENLNAIRMLLNDIVSKEKAIDLLLLENTPGNLNLKMFPSFREKIVEISLKD